MMTIDTILKELNNIPSDKLEDLYAIVHSFGANTKSSDKSRHHILSFAGSFGDMNENDYNDFLRHIKDTRTQLFDRNINL